MKQPIPFQPIPSRPSIPSTSTFHPTYHHPPPTIAISIAISRQHQHSSILDFPTFVSASHSTPTFHSTNHHHITITITNHPSPITDQSRSLRRLRSLRHSFKLFISSITIISIFLTKNCEWYCGAIRETIYESIQEAHSYSQSTPIYNHSRVIELRSHYLTTSTRIRHIYFFTSSTYILRRVAEAFDFTSHLKAAREETFLCLTNTLIPSHVNSTSPTFGRQLNITPAVNILHIPRSCFVSVDLSIAESTLVLHSSRCRLTLGQYQSRRGPPDITQFESNIYLPLTQVHCISN
jgi:hypothetical protein